MNKVTVRICDTEYTLMGEENQDYLIGLGEHVDQKIKSILKLEPKMTLVMASTLAAVNLADDYFKQLSKNSFLDEQMDEDVNKMEFNLQSSMVTKLENEKQELENQVQELMEENEEIKNLLATEESEVGTIANLKKTHEEELEEANNKTKKAEELATKFQNKLYDLQIEIEKLKKNTDTAKKN